MAYQFLNEIELDKPTKKVNVRITRLWRAVNPTEPDKLISLDFLATDARQNAMHMYVLAFEAPLFENLLKEGSVYTISRFQVRKARNYNAIPAALSICLTRATQIHEIHEELDSYPRHHFNFVSFEKLRERIEMTSYLTDVIGILTSFSAVMKVTLKNMSKETEKRDLHIQNLRGEEVKVAIYGKLIKEINELLLEQTTNLVFIFAGTLVKKYNGIMYLSTGPATKMHVDLEIPATVEFKNRYKNDQINVKFIGHDDNPPQIVVEQKTNQIATIS